jgi:hypothetical protein
MFASMRQYIRVAEDSDRKGVSSDKERPESIEHEGGPEPLQREGKDPGPLRPYDAGGLCRMLDANCREDLFHELR